MNPYKSPTNKKILRNIKCVLHRHTGTLWLFPRIVSLVLPIWLPESWEIPRQSCPRMNQSFPQYSCSGDPGNWTRRKQGNEENASSSQSWRDEPARLCQPPRRPRDIKSAGRLAAWRVGGLEEIMGSGSALWSRSGPPQSSPFWLITGPTSRTLLSCPFFHPSILTLTALT